MVMIFWGELQCLVAGVFSARIDFHEKGGEVEISQYKINKHYLKFSKYYEKLET
ncbi:hypothetical protein LP415_15640 [Polaromonas sp. P1(28)-8]|nr:hypothetical protein LP415_15640 [Polaromonas sp. P1(28)-8]